MTHAKANKATKPSNTDGEANVDNRLCELETRLAFQEDHLHELNILVAAQSSEISVLQKQLFHAYKKIKSIEADHDQGINNDEPPPHY